MPLLRRSLTEVQFGRKGKPRRPEKCRSLPASRTMFFNISPPIVEHENQQWSEDSFCVTQEGRVLRRRRSLTWQGYYMSRKAKVQQRLASSGPGRRRAMPGSYSASSDDPDSGAALATAAGSKSTDDPLSAQHDNDLATQAGAAPGGSSTGGGSAKTRKISLSCLVTSVLNFERGRRRASRAREEELLQAAEVGDLSRVRRFCDNEGRVNVSCTDPLGRTPLHLAVANEQKEVVQYLLGHVDMKALYQALMLAINLGHDEIAEMIIEHPLYEEISTDIRSNGQATFLVGTFNEDNQFSDEITPLILAAQQNRFEIVMALLMKGEVIGKPHRYNCFCDACIRSVKCDELKFAKARLNAYKGLASEAYISLSSEDPILTSFELRRELLNVCTDEKYYTAEYASLADQLSDYVVRLLDKVHSNEELNAILNADEKHTNETTLPRLSLAIEYKEKKFVAHPSVQKKLTSMWYANFVVLIQSRSRLFSCCLIATLTFFYPVLALVYIIHPFGIIQKLLQTPIVKFLAQATSFVLFLCLVLTHSYNEQTNICSTRFNDDPEIKLNWNNFRRNISAGFLLLERMCVRNHTPSFLEILILFWIVGFVWQECKQVYSNGCKAHFLDVYNHMDFFMLKFYIASMTLRQMQHVIVTNAYHYFRHTSSWHKLISGAEEPLYQIYYLNSDRYYWDAWDPYHVSEALFAVGNILNFTRLFYLLAISEHLGPMLISLEQMLKAVMKFFVSFIPILISFMVGLYNMYWYYNPAFRGQVELVDHNITTRAESAFGSLEYTFRTVYWSLFGLKDSKLVELQDWRKPNEDKSFLAEVYGDKGYQGRFTESVGYIVFGVYNWGAVIVLLNMLIAMMTRSFEKITQRQDIEWKFARSKLYMEYIETGSTLPVPFNIIPSVKSLRRCVVYVLSYCGVTKRCFKRHRRKEHDVFITVSSDSEKLNGECTSLRRASLSDSNLFTLNPSFPPPPPRRLNSLSTPEAAIKEEGPDIGVNELGVTELGVTDLKGNDIGGNDLCAGSPSQSPVHMPSHQPRGSFVWGGSGAGDPDDYRTVVKRVVRRYIFEHLQATVGSEGANEQQNAEAIRQEFHGVHQEISSIKPKVQIEFERVRVDMCDMRLEMRAIQQSLTSIHHQLAVVLKSCRDSVEMPRRDRAANIAQNYGVESQDCVNSTESARYNAKQAAAKLKAVWEEKKSARSPNSSAPNTSLFCFELQYSEHSNKDGPIAKTPQNMHSVSSAFAQQSCTIPPASPSPHTKFFAAKPNSPLSNIPSKSASNIDQLLSSSSTYSPSHQHSNKHRLSLDVLQRGKSASSEDLISKSGNRSTPTGKMELSPPLPSYETVMAATGSCDSPTTCRRHSTNGDINKRVM